MLKFIKISALLLLSHLTFSQNSRTEAVKKEIKIKNITTVGVPANAIRYVNVAFEYLEDGIIQPSALSINDLNFEANLPSATPTLENRACPPSLEAKKTSTGTYTFRYCISYIDKDTLLHSTKIALRSDKLVFDTKIWEVESSDEYMAIDRATTQDQRTPYVPNSIGKQLCFDVFDNALPYPVSAQLFIKPLTHTFTGGFTTISMSPSIPSQGFVQKWCGTVPSSLVLDPGFAYHTTATYSDGSQLKAPLFSDGTTEWHQPVSVANALSIIPIYDNNDIYPCSNTNLKITVSGKKFKKVALYYRELGASDYTSVDVYTYNGNGIMPDSSEYKVPIMVAATTLNYYIVATDLEDVRWIAGDVHAPLERTVFQSEPNNIVANRMILYFSNTIRIGCKALKVGDVISAYYKNACGTLSLAGKKIVINPSETRQTLYAYGNSSTTNKNGYDLGEPILVSITQDGIEHWITYIDPSNPYPPFAVGGILTWSNVSLSPTITLTPRFNAFVIPFADQTPSAQKGTLFDLGQNVKRSYVMNVSGCGTVTFEGIQSSNSDFVTTIDKSTGNFTIEYIGTKSSQATIIIKTSVSDYFFNVQAGTITSLKEAEISAENCSSTLFPNPVYDVLTISTCAKQGIISLLNTTGQILQKQEILGNGNQKMDVGDLAPGVYMLSIEPREGRKREILKVAIQ